MTTSLKRAVGVVRVSDVGGRDADHFVSPIDQRNRIEHACKNADLRLVRTFEEMDVSAGNPLSRRPGLRAAIEMVEAGQADTIVVAYFDRLVRSLRVQAEIVERVEKAGGAILAVDIGHLRADTAAHWLSGTLLGAVAEYQRRMTAERVEGALTRCVNLGIAPYARIPVGYRRGADRRLEVDPEVAPVVREAFAMRADGASWRQIDKHLRGSGVMRVMPSLQRLMKSRVVLGELRFGERVNLESHPPIIDVAMFERVQRTMSRKEAPGPKSDRLLARTRLMRCGTCGGTLVTGAQFQHGKRYAMFKCAPTTSRGATCSRRVAISADVVEALVVERVREVLADESATASRSDELDAARAQLAQRDVELAHAVAVLSGLGHDVTAARERLAELKAAVDASRERLAELELGAAAPLTVNAAADWSALTLDERRALVAAVVRRIEVLPGGRGPRSLAAERVRIVTVLDE